MSSPRVLVTGVFDVLHQEHVNFLLAAKELGELIIGVESDKRVRELKGESRPINGAAVRVQNLLDLGIASEVFILPDSFSDQRDHKSLLDAVHPDILAVSSHSNHLDAKRRLMQDIGGRVEVVHQHNPMISTTKLLSQEA